MKKHIHYSKGLVAALLISVILHTIFLITNPGNVFNNPEKYGEEISLYGSRDASLYAKQAFQLIDEGIYGYNSTEPNAYVTPGHPLYLAFLFKTADTLGFNPVATARVANLILSVLTTFLIYQISMHLFFNKAVSTISSLLYATYFSPLHYFRTLLTEIPGIFLLCMCMLFFIIALKENKNIYHIIFGILFSITVMIRPTPAPLILVCLFILIYKNGWRALYKQVPFWIFGPVLIIAPWILRNLITLGHPYIFSSHSGNPMLAGTNPFFIEKFSDIASKGKALGLTENQYAVQRIKEGFKKQPDLYISWFTIGKTIWLYRRPSDWHGYLPLYHAWTKLVYLQHFLVVLGGGLSGIILRSNKRVITLFLVILIYTGLSLLFIPDPRFGFFIIPVFCLIAGYGIHKLAVKLSPLLFRAKNVEE